MLKAMLFDMDGVIVDTEPLHHKAYIQMFEEVGIDVSLKMYAEFTGQSTMSICKQLCEFFNLKINPQKLVDIKRNNFTKLFYEDNQLKLIDGVEDLIKNYFQNGLKLVLASSASMFTINNITKRFDLDKCFMDKLSGADLKASKPHPEIFNKAARSACALNNECIVIEDSSNGILAAKRAGIFCIAYQSKNSRNQDYSLADMVISDYNKIKYENINQLL